MNELQSAQDEQGKLQAIRGQLHANCNPLRFPLVLSYNISPAKYYKITPNAMCSSVGQVCNNSANMKILSQKLANLKNKLVQTLYNSFQALYGG